MTFLLNYIDDPGDWLALPDSAWVASPMQSRWWQILKSAVLWLHNIKWWSERAYPQAHKLHSWKTLEPMHLWFLLQSCIETSSSNGRWWVELPSRVSIHNPQRTCISKPSKNERLEFYIWAKHYITRFENLMRELQWCMWKPTKNDYRQHVRLQTFQNQGRNGTHQCHDRHFKHN